MIVKSPLDLIKKAHSGKYAIGAFNVNNMEFAQAVMMAHEKKSAPVILQISSGARKYANTKMLVDIVKSLAEQYPQIPIILHQDHGADFEICKSAIDAGFNSVMIDASSHPFEENVRITKEVVEYAHAHGAMVEAEIGTLGGIEEHVSVDEKSAHLTDPNEAQKFVELTGCDTLACAIGTSHGAYKFGGESKIDIERIKEIQKKIPETPLVMHGSSSVPQEYVKMINQFGGNMPGAKGVDETQISEAVKWGVAKVNIDTDLRLVMTGMIRKFFYENPSEFDPRKYLGPAREKMQLLVEHKIEVLGSENKI